MAQLRYKRIGIKISGEALSNGKEILHRPTLEKTAEQIVSLVELGLEIFIVVGGGNIFRGGRAFGFERTSGDYMGMLATTINALALQNVLEQKGVPTRVQTAIEMRQIAEPYVQRKAVQHLEQGCVVIFAAGTGCPFFSTDTAIALRAAEMKADAILMAKRTDYVYTENPNKNPDAIPFSHLSYEDVIAKKLEATDTASTVLCKENHIPIILFGLADEDGFRKAVMGEPVGTIIDEGPTELLERGANR